MEWPENALARVLRAADMDPDDPLVQEVVAEVQAVVWEEARKLQPKLARSKIEAAVKAIAPVIIPLRAREIYEARRDKLLAEAVEAEWSGPLGDGDL